MLTRCLLLLLRVCCCVQIPAVKQIYAFLKQVFEVGQFNPECCVISLVYINRLIGVTGVPLTQSNWKPGACVLIHLQWR